MGNINLPPKLMVTTPTLQIVPTQASITYPDNSDIKYYLILPNTIPMLDSNTQNKYVYLNQSLTLSTTSPPIKKLTFVDLPQVKIIYREMNPYNSVAAFKVSPTTFSWNNQTFTLIVPDTKIYPLSMIYYINDMQRLVAMLSCDEKDIVRPEYVSWYYRYNKWGNPFTLTDSYAEYGSSPATYTLVKYVKDGIDNPSAMITPNTFIGAYIFNDILSSPLGADFPCERQNTNNKEMIYDFTQTVQSDYAYIIVNKKLLSGIVSSTSVPIYNNGNVYDINLCTPNQKCANNPSSYGWLNCQGELSNWKNCTWKQSVDPNSTSDWYMITNAVSKTGWDFLRIKHEMETLFNNVCLYI